MSSIFKVLAMSNPFAVLNWLEEQRLEERGPLMARILDSWVQSGALTTPLTATDCVVFLENLVAVSELSSCPARSFAMFKKFVENILTSRLQKVRSVRAKL
jgi:hypothetical protein